MTCDQSERSEVFCFVFRAAGMDAALDAVFRMGVDWAREHLSSIHRARGQLYRHELVRVAAEVGATVEELWAENKCKARSEQRWLAMWILRRRENLSYTAIARAMHRDHSTVHHGVQTVESRPLLLERARELLARTRTKEAA